MGLATLGLFVVKPLPDNAGQNELLFDLPQKEDKIVTMDPKQGLIKTGTVVVAGVFTIHGWGRCEVANQPHAEIDIQPPGYVQSTVITASGSIPTVASDTVIRVGSENFLLTSSTSVVVVKRL